MKKVALFVALVLIFGGLLTIGYFLNSRSGNAVSRTSVEKCTCEDPEQCKAEGKCDGECQDGGETCANEDCGTEKANVTKTLPYTPLCCQTGRDK